MTQCKWRQPEPADDLWPPARLQIEQAAASSELAVASLGYDRFEGEQVDRLLADIAERLQRDGVRLAGLVQNNEPRQDRRRCDMTVCDLTSGRQIRISQDLGRDSHGCRLDTRALEEAAGLVETAVRAGADLLILNRFGKREAEGRGLSGALALAVEHGLPVLVGLNRANAASWDTFAGGEASSLPLDGDIVLGWCRRMLRQAGRHPEPTLPPGSRSASVTSSGVLTLKNGSIGTVAGTPPAAPEPERPRRKGAAKPKGKETQTSAIRVAPEARPQAPRLARRPHDRDDVRAFMQRAAELRRRPDDD